MRFAIIADVHGNAPALEAVLAHIAGQGVSSIVNLGDVVSGPLWPRETCEMLMPLGLPTVRGNHDRAVGEASGRDGLYHSDAFAFDELSGAQRDWLRGLPVFLDVSPEIAAFHAVPHHDATYLLDVVVAGQLALDAPAAIAQRLGDVRRPFLLCGHSHVQRLAWVDGCCVINPGSVGCPGYVDDDAPAHRSEAGSPHARYAVLDTEAQAPVTFHAVEYDWTSASRRAAAQGREEWARALATGFV